MTGSEGIEAPVAQSDSARYLYGSMCASDAEVVSSILTWSIIFQSEIASLEETLSLCFPVYYTIFDVFEFVL